MHLHNRAAVRGNLASFPVHWDDVLERILSITEASNRTAALPHDGETLAHLVRFEFRMKDKDMSRHLKHMRLRPFRRPPFGLSLGHEPHLDASTWRLSGNSSPGPCAQSIGLAKSR